ncbi:MAG TPA: hypothetical protein VMM60_16785 [Ilumatobacter sp.]|nr:hypothetical protein [Ilumatobacter sp.]
MWVGSERRVRCDALYDFTGDSTLVVAERSANATVDTDFDDSSAMVTWSRELRRPDRCTGCVRSRRRAGS